MCREGAKVAVSALSTTVRDKSAPIQMRLASKKANQPRRRPDIGLNFAQKLAFITSA